MERKENNGFGPIFVDRRKRPVVIVGMILLTVTLVYRLDREAITFYSFIISSVIFGQLLRRIFLFAEEISHLETRHDGSYKKAIVHCLGIYTLSKVSVSLYYYFYYFIIFLSERGVVVVGRQKYLFFLFPENTC